MIFENMALGLDKVSMRLAQKRDVILIVIFGN